MVEATFGREPPDLDHEIFPQGAADAAIGHLHHLLIGPGQLGTTITHQRGIDVDFGHVVDDHGDSEALTIVQDMVE